MIIGHRKALQNLPTLANCEPASSFAPRPRACQASVASVNLTVDEDHGSLPTFCSCPRTATSRSSRFDRCTRGRLSQPRKQHTLFCFRRLLNLGISRRGTITTTTYSPRPPHLRGHGQGRYCLPQGPLRLVHASHRQVPRGHVQAARRLEESALDAS